MRLVELQRYFDDAAVLGDPETRFTDVHYDSRRVGPGNLFVAVPGEIADGHDFIDQSVKSGASALCIQADRRSLVPEDIAIPVLVVPDTRAALSTIAAAFHGFPGRKLNVVGITGTDGKTSLSHLVAHVLETAGEKTGLINSAECRIGDEAIGDSGRFTTPEAPEIQSMLATMVEHGCRWAVVEATSHGLALHRLNHLEPDIAAFTNITTDHLTFHRTLANYLAAKGRLFEMLDESPPNGTQKRAVLNLSDPATGFFRERTKARIVTYGIENGYSGHDIDVVADEMEPDGWGSAFTIHRDGERSRVRLPAPGKFNVYNALAAAAICEDVSAADTVRALETWPRAPGRMDFIDEGQSFRVVVDYAHGSDALTRVLQFLRPRTSGRMIVLFGCIGEREQERRARMGRAAARHADYTIVTDNNPYTEDRDAILEEIAASVTAAGRTRDTDFSVIPDRREAIAHALNIAREGDTILLAGKGHETKITLPNGHYECNDAEVAREVLRNGR